MRYGAVDLRWISRAFVTFVRVVDLGSFTRAAEALATSQAAISLRLKRLEDRLGTRLLDRTPRHVRRDPAGRQVPAGGPAASGGP